MLNHLTPDRAPKWRREFYSHIRPSKDSVLKSIKSNKAYLLQTVRELSKAHRAALTFVFLHRGRMPVGSQAPQMQDLIAQHYGVDREPLAEIRCSAERLVWLNLLRVRILIWIFKHPTISDALAATLGEVAGIRELYLRGVRAEPSFPR